MGPQTTITNALFEAFLRCKMKAHLLAGGAEETDTDIPRHQHRLAKTFEQSALQHLRSRVSDGQVCEGMPSLRDVRVGFYRLIVNPVIAVPGLRAEVHALSSNSVVGQRTAVPLGVELSNRFVDGAVEVIRTVERLMSEVMSLQVAPETLDVVQLRSIFRQPLDGEPVGALGERGAACLAGVDRAVVQDEHEGLDRDA